ncbi:MAG: hypothetical protein D6679_12060 [Candidatus Hydrogenedentota bacterium]|nr:MAG: hypothetical protein D6679_12060 [Candidatus Hydrogenedentota bacterium]
MKRTSAFLFAFLGFAAVAVFSACATVPYKVTGYFVSEKLDSYNGATVAVLPFRGGAGATVTDMANLELGRVNRWRLVERIRVAELYKEQDFDPDRVDDKTAAKIGRMLGAKAVVLGQVYEYTPGRCGVSMRLVDSETGEHLWQARDTLEYRNPGVRELAKGRFDYWRLRKDPEAMAFVTVRALAQTLSR